MKKTYNVTIKYIIEFILVTPLALVVLINIVLKVIRILIKAIQKVMKRLYQLLIDIHDDLVEVLSMKD